MGSNWNVWLLFEGGDKNIHDDVADGDNSGAATTYMIWQCLIEETWYIVSSHSCCMKPSNIKGAAMPTYAM